MHFRREDWPCQQREKDWGRKLYISLSRRRFIRMLNFHPVLTAVVLFRRILFGLYMRYTAHTTGWSYHVLPFHRTRMHVYREANSPNNYCDDGRQYDTSPEHLP